MKILFVTIICIGSMLPLQLSCIQRRSHPKALFYWTVSVGAEGPCAIELDTRSILRPEFHNNITGRQGGSENDASFIPGLSPLADELAQLEGIDTVHIYKHSIRIDYKNGYLNELNLRSEAQEVGDTLSNVLYPSVELIQAPSTRVYHNYECEIWEAPIRCRFDTLYVPKDRKIDLESIQELIGITSIDNYEDGDYVGYRRIHKSPLFTWEELKPQLQPLL